MHRIILAFRAFFRALFHGGDAARIERALDGAAPVETPPAKPAPTRPKPAAAGPVRSEALTLLATLQREARFVDFVMEKLDGYDDAQIGAAARDVHRECGKVIERLFGLKPLLSEEENADVEVPAGFDAGRYQLTGAVAGEPPFRGQLVHHGWEASRCDLAAWSGGKSSRNVVAPAEVELK